MVIQLWSSKRDDTFCQVTLSTLKRLFFSEREHKIVLRHLCYCYVLAKFVSCLEHVEMAFSPQSLFCAAKHFQPCLSKPNVHLMPHRTPAISHSFRRWACIKGKIKLVGAKSWKKFFSGSFWVIRPRWWLVLLCRIRIYVYIRSLNVICPGLEPEGVQGALQERQEWGAELQVPAAVDSSSHPRGSHPNVTCKLL